MYSIEDYGLEEIVLSIIITIFSIGMSLFYWRCQ